MRPPFTVAAAVAGADAPVGGWRDARKSVAMTEHAVVIAEVGLAEEPQWGRRRDALRIHSLSH
ncbi:MAG TPA: hypothetical protein VF812_06010 [Ktedonobacterales bacterium]